MPPASALMQLAIAAARSVEGSTSPNPWVGAVLEREGRVVASGATAPPGGPHAEVAALAGVDARGATLYTTLEPCAPFEGKRTRPCADAIVAAGVARVVVALQDPDPRVSGHGIEILARAGVAVEVGDGASEVQTLLRPYLKHRETSTPYVIAKFAVSLDGKVGAPASGVRWLTGPAAIERAHRDRARIDAILAGSGTVLADDPRLSARPDGRTEGHQPVRIVLDSRGRIPADASVLAGPGGTIVATTRASSEAWRGAVSAAGATVLELEAAPGGVNLHQLSAVLGRRGVLSLLVEGGPAVLASCFEEDLVNEVHAYIAPRLLGPAGLPLFPDHPVVSPAMLDEVVVEPLPPDVLVRGYTGTWRPA